MRKEHVLVTDNTILGLDIGTSKICAVAGAKQPDGSVRIIAFKEQHAEGVRAGNIINIESVIGIISNIRREIEIEAACEIKQIVTGVSGSHIEGLMSQGVVGIHSKDQEIRSDDIYRSMEVARAFELPLDREILHTLVQDFSIDGRSGIKDPIDMIGHRLETKVMIVTGSVTASQNIDKCIKRSGLITKRRVLQQLADSEALLSSDEKEMGTLLINLGAGMTNMVGYLHGAPVFVGGIDIGGSQVTADLAFVLNQPLQLIEEMKIAHGSCYEPMIDDHEMVILPQVGGLPSIRMPRKELCKIIEPRVAETFAMLRNMLDKRGLLHSFGGVALTGGGAMMPGATELAAELFDRPARRASFKPFDGFDVNQFDLRYSTAIGLVLYDARRSGVIEVKPDSRPKRGLGSKIKNVFETLF